MENGKDWQYNTSITIRLDRKLKNRITREAESRGMSISEYFRTFYENAELPDAFLDRLASDRYRECIEKYIAMADKTGRSRYDILKGLVSQCVEYAMNNGFIRGFRPY
jgi:hypothetical protein